jgi:hypothetical protein
MVGIMAATGRSIIDFFVYNEFNRAGFALSM